MVSTGQLTATTIQIARTTVSLQAMTSIVGKQILLLSTRIVQLLQKVSNQSNQRVLSIYLFRSGSAALRPANWRQRACVVCSRTAHSLKLCVGSAASAQAKQHLHIIARLKRQNIRKQLKGGLIRAIIEKTEVGKTSAKEPEIKPILAQRSLGEQLIGL